MGKISIQDLGVVLVEHNSLNKKDASDFVSSMFDIIQEFLEKDRNVKIKGLGTFKIIDVEDRESVNVNTGERVLIEGHGKITFTPDPLMKELVNKPFSQFETVVLNEGVDFAEVHDEIVDTEGVLMGTPLENPEQSALPLMDFDHSEPDVITLESEIPSAVSEVTPVEEETPLVAEGTPLSEEKAPLIEEETPVDDEETTHTNDEAPLIELSTQEESIDEESSTSKKWLWIAVLALLSGLIVGYVLGNYFPFTNHQPPQNLEVKQAPTQKPASIVKDKPQLEQPQLEQPETQPTEPVTQPVEPASQPAKTDVAPETKTTPVTSEEDIHAKYAAKDVRVKTGAYRIVGTLKVVKAKEGDNLAKLSRQNLGPGMECYVEAYNDLKASSPLKVGQEIKIPELVLKKKKKTE